MQNGLYSVDINKMSLQVADQSIVRSQSDGDRLANANCSLDNINKLEAELLKLPQIDCPLHHSFAPHVYLREITMPEGAFIIGREHTTEHFNIILTGRASVLMDGVVHEIQAPCIIKSNAGVRKILYIHETMRWATVHPTDETNIEILEETLTVKTPAFRDHEMRKQFEDFQKKLIELKEKQ